MHKVRVIEFNREHPPIRKSVNIREVSARSTSIVIRNGDLKNTFSKLMTYAVSIKDGIKRIRNILFARIKGLFFFSSVDCGPQPLDEMLNVTIAGARSGMYVYLYVFK